MQDLKNQCIEPETGPYLKVINFYGHRHQIGQAISKMGELTTNLAFDLAGRVDPELIIGDIAVVKHMIQQLEIIYDPDGKVPGIMETKMNREMDRIDGREKRRRIKVELNEHGNPTEICPYDPDSSTDAAKVGSVYCVGLCKYGSRIFPNLVINGHYQLGEYVECNFEKEKP